MKVAAALLAMAAATVAARSTGTGAESLIFSIEKITYTTVPEANRETGDPLTDICVDKDGVFDKPSLVSLAIREGEGTEKNHEPTEDQSGVGDNCIRFAAPIPNDGSVFYTLGVSAGGTVTHDRAAKVNFNFEGLDGATYIKCTDKQSFKITTELNCPEQMKGTTDCYEPTSDPPLGENCVEPNGDGFQYCQPEAEIKVFEQDGVSSAADSLAYQTDTATLTVPGTIAAGDVLIAVGDNSDKAQVSVLTEESNTVTLKSFERSSNTYTACPVVEGDFTAYTINDLHILATKQNEDDGKDYYEFGLKYVVGAPSEYQASTPAAAQRDGADPNTVRIDCSGLTPGPEKRCYGWVKAGAGELTVSYYKNGESPSNNIILASDQIKPSE